MDKSSAISDGEGRGKLLFLLILDNSFKEVKHGCFPSSTTSTTPVHGLFLVFKLSPTEMHEAVLQYHT